MRFTLLAFTFCRLEKFDNLAKTRRAEDLKIYKDGRNVEIIGPMELF